MNKLNFDSNIVLKYIKYELCLRIEGMGRTTPENRAARNHITTFIFHMKLKNDGWEGMMWKIHKNNSFNNISKNHMFA